MSDFFPEPTGSILSILDYSIKQMPDNGRNQITGHDRPFLVVIALNQQLEDTIKKYGLPMEILTDIGLQFIPMKDQKSKAKFGKILESRDINHRKTGLLKPNMNYKVERFNRTLQDKFIRGGNIESLEEAKKNYTSSSTTTITCDHTRA